MVGEIELLNLSRSLLKSFNLPLVFPIILELEKCFSTFGS